MRPMSGMRTIPENLEIKARPVEKPAAAKSNQLGE
jgi:hypothetical protein